MEKTTSRKLARVRLLEAQRDATVAREKRERANLTDLTEFTVRMAQVDEVDDWLAGRLEKLREEAERKRLGHRSAAGKALHACVCATRRRRPPAAPRGSASAGFAN